MDQVAWARDLAAHLLAKSLPRRWSHVQGVGRTAESIAHIVRDDAEILACAAWLHDIGYSPRLKSTGLHALDGARYLRDQQKSEGRLCRLVAHHSLAAIEASRRGLSDILNREFPPLDGLLMDALTYCDMTTDPDGNTVDVAVRLREIEERYGANNIITQSIREAEPHILDAVRRIKAVGGW